MLATGKPDFRPSPPRSGVIARYAIGGAWLFLVASLLHIAWGLAMVATSPDGFGTLYQVNTDGETHRALGLTYDGAAGVVLAVMQGALVLGAIGLSLLPASRGRRTARLRRMGHAMLIGWAGLWMINVLRLASILPHPLTVVQTIVMAVFLGCTIYRAVAPRPPRLTRGDVSGSRRVREVPVAPMPKLVEKARESAKRMGSSVADSTRRAGAWLAPRMEPAVSGVRESARRLVGRDEPDDGEPSRNGWWRRSFAWLRRLAPRSTRTT